VRRSKTVIVGSSVGLHACRAAIIAESRRQWCPSALFVAAMSMPTRR